MGLAGILAGVEMPEQITSNGETLYLNGMGLRGLDVLTFTSPVCTRQRDKRSEFNHTHFCLRRNCEIIFPRVPNQNGLHND